MPFLDNVSWTACIEALRRAGFVWAAESPSNVVLVGAGRTVLLHRAPILDETVLQHALRCAGLSDAAFIALLSEAVAERVATIAHSRASETWRKAGAAPLVGHESRVPKVVEPHLDVVEHVSAPNVGLG